MAESSDSTTPERGDEVLPVVGLGGSAGSLAALQTFFEGMPANSGMAFVVILHLSPEHESLMAEILQRSSAMPVIEVRTEEEVQANRVYVSLRENIFRLKIESYVFRIFGLSGADEWPSTSSFVHWRGPRDRALSV